ncbi:MAG: energy transducer TonB [Acidobacteriota bacterium]|nr:energy transducer TonB [Acidobacteriota bacterium]
MARPSQLEGRLRAILDARIPRAGHGRAALAASILAALVFAAPLATVRAQSKSEQAAPPDVPTVIFRANAEKNHELLDRAAASYESQRKFDTARTLLEAGLPLRKQEGTASYAEGLVQLGDLAVRQHAGTEALQYYRQAAALGDMPETVPALIALGVDAAFTTHDTQAATGYLERARNAARAGNQAGRAMTWLALVAQEDPTRAAQAESIYRSARSLEDPGSPDQAITTDLLARFLRSQNRGAEAAQFEQEAAAMHRALVAKLTTPFGSPVDGPRKVGGGVSAPRLLSKVEPSYSDAARAAKFQGTTVLKVVVDTDGRAKDIQIVRALGMGLDEKAVEAVNQWVFSPGQAAGAAVPVQATIEVNFRLL